MRIGFIFFQETVEKAAAATSNAQETIANMIEGSWAHLPYVAVGLVVFVLFLFGAAFSRMLIKAGIERAGLDVMIASLIARLGFIAITIIGFFVAAVVVFPGLSLGDLLAGLGIGSVALGFALKDVLQNLFAGFLILLYRPFQIGDQIKVDDFEGTVEEISIRATKIKTYDNEMVIIPNSELYMNSVLVRTAFPNRRTSFVVGIGYEDDIEEARQTLFEVLSETEGVLKDPAPTVDVDTLGDNAVNLKIRFWTDSVRSSVRKATNDLVTKIKYALDEKGIDMPYPT
ncbi:MAG: mechanosensitive ion channel family protein, partial [Acidobacteriota bacterium]|nr:mechanosensitive ion channel family protein [Acidobacteriota bacterium]